MSKKKSLENDTVSGKSLFVSSLSGFYCPKEGCSDYGKTGEGNIVLKERYGKNRTALLKCKTCGKCFSENRGTPFFRLQTSKETVLRAMAMLVEN